MRTILTIVTLTLSLSTFAKSEVSKSDITLRQCLAKVYSDTKRSNKEVNADAKSCRDSVKEMRKAERLAKKRAKLNERIAKLQKELSETN